MSPLPQIQTKSRGKEDMEGDPSSLYPECKHIRTPWQRTETLTVCWAVNCTVAMSGGLCPILCTALGGSQGPALNCWGMADANSHLGH